MLPAALILIGCTSAQIINERDVGVDAAVRDAGVDTAAPDVGMGECVPGIQDNTGMPTGCMRRLTPPRPRCGDDPTDVGRIELALLDPRFRPAGDNFGYDLDGFCTASDGAPSSCNGTLVGDVSADGIDNVWGSRIFDVFISARPGIEAEIQTAVRSARGTPLVRLDGWNGLANDETITATFAAAAPGMDLPVWDGTDVLPTLDTFFTGGDPALPIAEDSNAYVADSVLVMKLPDNQPLDFSAGGRTVRVRFRQATLTVDLNGDATTLGRSVLQGRWNVNDAISDLSFIGICEGTGDPVVELMRMTAINLMNMNVDLAGASSEDGTGVDCVAMSIAVAFETGVRVTWGAPQTVNIISPCI